MTRFFCAAVFVLLGVARAAAVPTAQYNPTTGNITFVDVGFSGHLVIESASGAIIQNFAGGVGFDPSTGVYFQDYYTNYAGFLSPWLPGVEFPDPFNAGKVVTPGTPVSDLLLNYRTHTGDYSKGAIEVVPEPATSAAACLAILSITALRRRK